MASIRKRRNKWQVQIRRHGCAALTKSFTCRKDAETWARQQEVQIDRRDLPQDPRQLERILLRDLVIRYQTQVTPKKFGRDVERIVFNAFLRHPICRKRLSDLSSVDFANYRDQRLSRVKASTLKREFSPLHNLFKVAKNEWGLPIKENPLDRVKLESPSNRRQRRLAEGELERIVEAAKKTKNPMILPMVLFAIETGLRRSEILAARWSDLDRANRLLTIPRAKNGHSRVIPLSQGALAVLSAQRPNMDDEENATDAVSDAKQPIFSTTANALRLAWERLLARAGISDLHFHDLRHEAVSRFFELGLTIPEVALISGHRDARMLFRYSHPQQQRIIQQMDKK